MSVIPGSTRTDVCRAVEPPLAEYASGHLAACHHPLDVTPAEAAAARVSPLSPLTAHTAGGGDG